jgi:predicted metal-dependent hydrolase
MTKAGVLPARLTVGRLTFDVVPRPGRRTLEITVERDASLTIKAPPTTSVARVEAFVDAKQDWIYRKLAEKDALLGAPTIKQFVNGEGFTYLGRNYRLLLVDTQDVPVKLERGRLRLRRDALDDAAATVRTWYATAGQTWLGRRIGPWAARIGASGVSVRVADLGYRWGSTRGLDHINIHWATLQLRPGLIDYVIVHELAHLHEENHTPQFWRHVEQAMPDYRPRKQELAAVGARVWLENGSA